MKQYLSFLTLIVAISTASCSKKSNEAQPNNNTLTIGNSSYPTVVIGNQTWTSVNYNGDGGINYNNSQTNSTINGKLYTVAEAKAIVLPADWHLPTQDDYVTLFTAIGAQKLSNGSFNIPSDISSKLMSTSTWASGGGNNSTGFNAVAAGFYDQAYSIDQSKFIGAGTSAVFLSSSNYNLTTQPVSFSITNDLLGLQAGFSNLILFTTDRGSIRFVKNN